MHGSGVDHERLVKLLHWFQVYIINMFMWSWRDNHLYGAEFWSHYFPWYATCSVRYAGLSEAPS